jgi:hypothetical protein
MRDEDVPTAAGTRAALRRAFPQKLRSVVDEALAVVPPPSEPRLDYLVLERSGIGLLSVAGQSIGPLSVAGQSIVMPYRIYSPEPAATDKQSLSPEAAIVLACAYSRHKDGFVRERALREFVREGRPWIVPFVVQLLGEYVPEIADVVVEALKEMSRPAYERFDGENPGFVELTQQHAISYWANFYRGRYLLSEYPPVRAIFGLGMWHWPAGQRRLARGKRLTSQ